MPESEEQRNQKAEDLAYERGREAEKIDAHLTRHDEHFKELNGSVGEAARRLTSVEASIARMLTLAEAAAKGQVSKWQFYGALIGASVLIVAILGLVLKQ